MKRVLLASAVSAALMFSATPAVFAETAEAAGEAPIVLAEAPTVLAAAPGEAVGATGAAPERRAFRMPSERVEARLAYMRTALKITDAQQSQWDNFANVFRKHARDMDQRIQKFRAQREQGAQRPERRSVSAIERLERTQQRMQARAARLNEVLGAAKPLYATFSPEQKQVADEMLSRGQRGGHRGHQRHHRGMHRGA